MKKGGYDIDNVVKDSKRDRRKGRIMIQLFYY
jgi:hypothetical protein